MTNTKQVWIWFSVVLVAYRDDITSNKRGVTKSKQEISVPARDLGDFVVATSSACADANHWIQLTESNGFPPVGIQMVPKWYSNGATTKEALLKCF